MSSEEEENKKALSQWYFPKAWGKSKSSYDTIT